MLSTCNDEAALQSLCLRPAIRSVSSPISRKTATASPPAQLACTFAHPSIHPSIIPFTSPVRGETYCTSHSPAKKSVNLPIRSARQVLSLKVRHFWWP